MSEMTESTGRLRVLFLCTHNSARSQLAEAILRQIGGDRVAAFSAGTQPARVHANAVALLESKGIDTSPLRSKHLEEFIEQRFDYVITVCDHAQEVCPVFPGARRQLHWSFPDPSAEREPAARREAFAKAYAGLEAKISDLLLPTID